MEEIISLIKESFPLFKFENDAFLLNGKKVVEIVDDNTIRVCTKGNGQLFDIVAMDFRIIIEPMIRRTLKRFS